MTQRKCATNVPNTCACQGMNENSGGASFTFGCSWSMYFNLCKYARSKIDSQGNIRKFKLLKEDEESTLESHLQYLATVLSPVYERTVPHAFDNMRAVDNIDQHCRIGTNVGKRAFSGVTAVCDFCAHAHKDVHNMDGGLTMVLTLTKPESRDYFGNIAPPDEQLHVLPHYRPDTTDEFGSERGQLEKRMNGGIQALTSYRAMLSQRAKPIKKCKRGHPTASRKKFLDSVLREKHAKIRREKGLPGNSPQKPKSPVKKVTHNIVGFGNGNPSITNGNVKQKRKYVRKKPLPDKKAGAQTPTPSGASTKSASGEDPAEHLTGPRLPGWMQELMDESGKINSQTAQELLPNVQWHQHGQTSGQSQAFMQPGSQMYSPAQYTPQPSQPTQARPMPYQFYPHQQVDGTSDLDESVDLGCPSFKPDVNSYEKVFLTPHKSPERDEGLGTPSPVPQLDGEPGVLAEQLPVVFQQHRQQTFVPVANVAYYQQPYTQVHYQPSQQIYHVQVNNVPPQPYYGQSVQQAPPPPYPPQQIQPVHQPQQADQPQQAPPAHQPHQQSWTFGLDRPNGISNPAPAGNQGHKLDNQAHPAQQVETNQVHKPSYDQQRSLTFGLDRAGEPPAPVQAPPAPTAIPNIKFETTDCTEEFQDIEIGGLALRLPHGSALFECAKAELHATTALRNPNRVKPTRIGLVFYQHRNLDANFHGHELQSERFFLKNKRDYELWKLGKFVPSARKLQIMKDDGFVFPDNVKVASKNEMMPEDEEDLSPMKVVSELPDGAKKSYVRPENAVKQNLNQTLTNMSGDHQSYPKAGNLANASNTYNHQQQQGVPINNPMQPNNPGQVAWTFGLDTANKINNCYQPQQYYPHQQPQYCYPGQVSSSYQPQK